MRAAFRFASLAAVSAMLATSASAQPAAAGDAANAPPQSTSGADQVVGLFGATCLHFAGNAAGLRGFLTQQGAAQMPEQARAAFLANRAGQVFDVSVPKVNLALVSLDDGGCEAVVENADPQAVVANLQQAATEAKVPLTPLGTQADKQRAGVQHAAFSVTVNGRTMHILVSTASTPPQAVLTLAPK